MADTDPELIKKERYVAAADRPSFDLFHHYVALHPEGEPFRNWVTQSGRSYVMVPCYSDSLGLPGDYFFAYIFTQYRPLTQKERREGRELRSYVPSGFYGVHVGDRDRSFANRLNMTWNAALAEFETLKMLAPFYLNELQGFGYEVR